ncbi:MAG: DUF6282 family protein [Veillonellales bacterium]
MDTVLDELVAGAVDMHVHSSPDVVPRKLTDIGVALQAKQAGLAGVLLKGHYCATASRAALVRESVPGIRVYGGVVLNQAVGGLNPCAVATEVALGAKEVWLPTISALNHLRFNHQDLEKGVPVVDDQGKLLPALYEVLEVVAGADVILGTGHLSTEETEKVITAALKKGVSKILVTHPEWEVTAMPVAVQQRLAAKGVYFERCFYASNSPQKLPVSELVNQIKAVGAASTVLSSDFGQVFNEEPAVGFRRFLDCMLQGGISPLEIEIMIKKNPNGLLA